MAVVFFLLPFAKKRKQLWYHIGEIPPLLPGVFYECLEVSTVYFEVWCSRFQWSPLCGQNSGEGFAQRCTWAHDRCSGQSTSESDTRTLGGCRGCSSFPLSRFSPHGHGARRAGNDARNPHSTRVLGVAFSPQCKIPPKHLRRDHAATRLDT